MTATSPTSLITPESEPSEGDLDTFVDELTAGSARWAQLSLTERSDLLAATHAAVGGALEAWANDAIAAKGTPPEAEGEEWLSGPYVTMRGISQLISTLTAISEDRSPVDGVPTANAPGNRVALKVMPNGVEDQLLLSGFSARVWLQPGVSISEARRRAGLGARRVGENGGVGLVLGAGNISAIGPLDVLYELVAYNRASILKLNPTFATLLPAYERAFAPLIEFGVLRIVNGGARVGGYLAQHPKIDHVHITGSGATHDAIVWGTGAEGDRRRAANEPQLHKPITSELGGVSPIIVIPGEWSDRDLRFQAENVATMRLQNGGHNCIGGQVLIMSEDWPQREAFLGHLRVVLDELPARGPWYPGAAAKIEAAATAHPDAERRGADRSRILIAFEAESHSDVCQTEYFASVLAHTTLPGVAGDFLRAAVEFANDELMGTLGANVIVAPNERRMLGGLLDHELAELRYGTIAINTWSALGFLSAECPWGAYPGHTLANVGSGIGIVHNALLLDCTERTIVEGPFRPFPRSILGGELSFSPRPPWFVTNPTGTVTAQRITRHAADPSPADFVGIFASALRG